ALEAQRLPGGVVPEHYALTLTPELHAAAFSGDETIDVFLVAPSKKITLNAAELKIISVQESHSEVIRVVTKGGGQREFSGTMPGKFVRQDGYVLLSATDEQATFLFPKELPAGKVSLTIHYTGVLNNKLRGFYLSKTKTRNYAVTQFEPTDARRAYPSFDEPALKATYDISL